MRGIFPRGIFAIALGIPSLIACGDTVEPARAPIAVHVVTPAAPSEGAPLFEHVDRSLRLGEEIVGAGDFEGWIRLDRGDPHEGESIRRQAPFHHIQLVGVLTEAGSHRFAEATERRQGEWIAVTVDGRVSMVARVATRIDGGRVVIFDGREEEARSVETALDGR